MGRLWIIAGLTVTALASAAAYRSFHLQEFRYLNTRLMADLNRPDALIRTNSLSRLPRDLLTVPLVRDVLTEDLVFYYEQHEDRLGFKGAIKRIAYEHQLDWSDRILSNALDEPAEVALWRDGKGALRHFALVMRRNMLAKVMQQAAKVALNDTQLKSAGEIDTKNGKASIYALELNPRRTLLLISQGERVVVLSNPGLLFDHGNKLVPEAEKAVVAWLENEGTLARRFALEEPGTSKSVQPAHTIVIGAPALTLGYTSFLSSFGGLRLDFGGSWATRVWIDPKDRMGGSWGDGELWKAAPAHPSACVLLPIDWQAAAKVVHEGNQELMPLNTQAVAALKGSALACWYSESTLYSPVFIVRLEKNLPERDAALGALAQWALSSSTVSSSASKKNGDEEEGEEGEDEEDEAEEEVATDSEDNEDSEEEAMTGLIKTVRPAAKKGEEAVVWQLASRGKAAKKAGEPALAAQGNYVVFSPDDALVNLTLDTLARKNPSVADQLPTSKATLALITPRPLSAMAEKEALAALSGPGDANLRAAAQTHLPPRMKALAQYPPYRLELPAKADMQSGWQRVEWRTAEESK